MSILYLHLRFKMYYYFLIRALCIHVPRGLAFIPFKGNRIYEIQVQISLQKLRYCVTGFEVSLKTNGTTIFNSLKGICLILSLITIM